MTPIASILIPSRLRSAMLVNACNSYFDLADNPAEVEIIARLHDDDPESLQWAATRRSGIRVIIGDTGRGYDDISKFLNCMAAVSTGNWLAPFSDDHVMLTKGWDTKLRAFGSVKEPKFAIVPIQPSWGRTGFQSRGLYDALGTLGETGHADCYIDTFVRHGGDRISVKDRIVDSKLSTSRIARC